MLIVGNHYLLAVIEKAEYRQSIAGAVQTVILTTYIFVECLYALIYLSLIHI